MKLNHRPTKLAFCDFETQSSCDLKEQTVNQYAQHPSTRALTVCLKVDGVMHEFGPYLDDSAKQKLCNLTEGRTIVAHNASFDAAVWEQTEKLPDREWFDTLPCCRAAGYPGKLDQVSQLLGLGGKDKNGKLLIDLLCILKRGFVPPVGPAHKLLLDYNRKDVEDLERIYEVVHSFGDPDVIEVDRAVNDRGIPVDRAYLLQLKSMFDANEADSRQEFANAAGQVNPGSPKQMKAWLLARGFDVPACNKLMMKELLADPDKYFCGDDDRDAAFEAVRDALELRREIVRVSGSKVDTALRLLEPDGRIRDQHVYYGAHTGRFSGRSLQIHNFAASAGLNTPEVHQLVYDPTYAGACRIAEQETAKREAEAEARGEPKPPRVSVSDVLGSLLRPMVRSTGSHAFADLREMAGNAGCPGLVYADYGAVELRGLAWLVGGGRMLGVLSQPNASIYSDVGESVFGRRIGKSDVEYGFCKQLVLGCNYGMSGSKFAYMCKIRNTSTATLKRAGITVEESVKLFRNTYPELPIGWRAFGDAAKECVQTGRSTFACRCEFHRVGRDMHMLLPSGRPIVYRNARIEMLIPGWQKLYGMAEQRVATIVFDKPKSADGGKLGYLYGSRIAENATQGMCADLLTFALVNAERAGLMPVLHVHDELCCEQGPEKLAALCELMSTPPEWAEGFPLLVEGCAAPIWTKCTKCYTELKAFNGRVLTEAKAA